MNLRPFKFYRVYLDALNLSNVGDFSWTLSKRDARAELSLSWVLKLPNKRRNS